MLAMQWAQLSSVAAPWRALMPFAGMLLLVVRLARGKPRDAHRRGALVRVAGRARPRRSRSSGLLSLAGVPLTLSDETRHFKLIGTTGTGKSTAIAELLGQALARGDRAIITDPDGGYRARFYAARRGDIILNPFDPLSVKWDPFAEITQPWDIEQLAAGLIPNTDDPSGREWRGYARTFLAAVTRRCHELGRSDAAELLRLLTIASAAELQLLVAGSPAQPFLEPENARMFGSIRSVAGSAAAALEYLQGQRTRAFSVRRWVRAGHGVLFVPYGAAQIPALRSIIATWIRLAIFEAMSGETERRLWFVIDELDALGQIDGLKDALARLRKFGGRCILGFQSIAQVSATYGVGEAQTIVENCGTTLILRCSGSEHGGTSQFASRLIGEREVLRRHNSRGRDHEGHLGLRGARRSHSVSEQTVTEAAVLAAELEQLPDLTGYLKTAGAPEWRRVRIARCGM
jgi:type IV secretory pathway TraG/TraD family ATPase VirD4